MNKNQRLFKSRVGFSLILLIGLMITFSVVPVGRVAAQSAEQGYQEVTPEQAGVLKWALIAAAAAFGFGALAAGFAISNVGAAAMGAIGEKPEIAGQALIFIALAEGLVVFGFITALMILGKI